MKASRSWGEKIQLKVLFLLDELVSLPSPPLLSKTRMNKWRWNRENGWVSDGVDTRGYTCRGACSTLAVQRLRQLSNHFHIIYVFKDFSFGLLRIHECQAFWASDDLCSNFAFFLDWAESEALNPHNCCWLFSRLSTFFEAVLLANLLKHSLSAELDRCRWWWCAAFKRLLLIKRGQKMQTRNWKMEPWHHRRHSAQLKHGV